MLCAVRTMLIAVACAVVAVSGCSGSVEIGDATIQKEKLEQGIADSLEKAVGQRPDSVTCPNSVPAKAGAKVRCVLSAGNVRYGLTATITSYRNGNAHYKVTVDQQPMK
jgi:Domain of unknown function (DUF4333)